MEPETQQGEILRRRISRRDAMKAGGIAAVGLAFSKPIIQTIQPKPSFANLSPVGSCISEIFNPGTISPIPGDPEPTLIIIPPPGFTVTKTYVSDSPVFDCSFCGGEKCVAEDEVIHWRLVTAADTSIVLATADPFFSSIPGVSLEDGFAPSGKNELVKVVVDSTAHNEPIHLMSDRKVICSAPNCPADEKVATSPFLTINIIVPA